MERLPELSPREFEMVLELSKGFSEKQIAERTYVSPKTVNNHLYNVRKKWNARCAVDVVRKFILSLDNPKQYFTAIVCLLIQLGVTTVTPEADLRRPGRSTTRIVRIARRNLN